MSNLTLKSLAPNRDTSLVAYSKFLITNSSLLYYISKTTSAITKRKGLKYETSIPHFKPFAYNLSL